MQSILSSGAAMPIPMGRSNGATMPMVSCHPKICLTTINLANQSNTNFKNQFFAVDQMASLRPTLLDSKHADPMGTLIVRPEIIVEIQMYHYGVLLYYTIIDLQRNVERRGSSRSNELTITQTHLNDTNINSNPNAHYELHPVRLADSKLKLFNATRRRST